ncbi:hypothetical protein Nepgr_025119 [Nepenthes gracilis]|uniref:RING-type domain-containing protein n=1 Tax=Nepenthes gracilis TaxID=150966 RepID=A0AAD3T631_NEPGR|nr:hypothetical protein Nepgr_025119 [Nepenthes gracilis]
MPRNSRRRHRKAGLRFNPYRSSAAAVSTSRLSYALPQTPSQSLAQSPIKSKPKFLSLLRQALIMALVISLFVVFVGIATVIFIHLCIAGGRVRRRHRNQPKSDRTRSGYSPEELKSLPITKLKPETEWISGELCAICLDNLSEGDWCRVLPDCKHLFHSHCVDKWLLKVATCPVCRTAIRSNLAGKRAEIGGDNCAQYGQCSDRIVSI